MDSEEAVPQNQYQLAMGEALARHEQALLRVGQLKKLQEKDFNQQIKMQEEIVNAEREQDKFKKVQLNTELGQQIREKQEKLKAEVTERKQLVMTSGGPTMEAEDVEELNKKHKQ